MRRIGDLLVHPVAFGAMNLSIEGRPSRDTAIATVNAALDEGVNLLDTADVYGLDGADAHHNERLLAEARRHAYLATKIGVRREGEAWVHDGRPAYLRAACEASLRALRVDTIDLLHLHAVDDRVPIEESVGALGRLREEGKVRLLGVSNASLDEVSRAMAVTEIASVQNEVSLYVSPDPNLLELCRARGVAFLGYAPMGGWRAGRLAHEPRLRELSLCHGRTPFELVIAALVGVSLALIPVAGASRPENARSSARAAHHPLPAEDAVALLRPFWEQAGPGR